MKKSISYTVCKYDYTPDYEETYKGYKFTVGIELYGNIGATIEFPSINEIYKLFNIDNPESKPNHATHRGRCPMLDKHFDASDADIFGPDKDSDDDTGCLLVRVPFENRFTGSHQFVTSARLEQARRKYRASFKKYSDVMPNFINQQKFVTENPLDKRVANMSDEEIISIIDDLNEVMKERGGRVKYLTIESLSEICRQFIDDYIAMTDTTNKHSAMLDKIKNAFDDRSTT